MKERTEEEFLEECRQAYERLLQDKDYLNRIREKEEKERELQEWADKWSNRVILVFKIINGLILSGLVVLMILQFIK